MAKLPSEKELNKRRNTAEKFANAHGYEAQQIEEIIANNPHTWKQELDRKAMANITHKDRYKKGIAENITPDKMRNLGGVSYGGTMPEKLPFIGGKKVSFGTSDVNRFVDMLATDYDKSIGHNLHGRGVESGYGHTLAQSKMAGLDTRLKDFGKHLNPLGGSARESFMMSMGFTGRDSRILAAKGGFMENLNRRAMAPAFGVFMAAGAMDSDNPLTEYATGVAVGAGVQQGWRAGKSFGNIAGFKGPSHLKRLGFGGLGAGIMAAVPAAVILGQSDMFKNDSFIAKQAKSVYSRESFSSTYDTQASMTMRRAGLEKLSSSYLNNRQQLLGNEASILRNSAI